MIDRLADDLQTSRFVAGLMVGTILGCIGTIAVVISGMKGLAVLGVILLVLTLVAWGAMRAADSSRF